LPTENCWLSSWIADLRDNYKSAFVIETTPYFITAIRSRKLGSKLVKLMHYHTGFENWEGLELLLIDVTSWPSQE
jgi:hypothetical protein